ncbi:hypothetical protein K402DRAFT_339387 [Aulographum hederae CBS 113979]|uniref:DNA mismatch repair protein MSH5 n=1 Tax=Aulographum hederae CBS 113979 TaxID=1176131 RepID=A0A6G1GQA4_9PEZI|nr:hypothetical protein K402DRAFT_339387 [Aulographum hederae CBS 113979]
MAGSFQPSSRGSRGSSTSRARGWRGSRTSRRSRGTSKGSTRSQGSRQQSTVPSETTSSRVSSTPLPVRRKITFTAPQRSIRPHSAAQSSSRDVQNEHAQSSGTTDPPGTDEDLDDLNEIVMAVDLRDRGTVGCSYYVAREEKLYFMEDMKLGGVEVVDALKLHIEPTIVLVSTRADDTLIDRLDPEARSRGSVEDSDQFSLPFLLEVRPSSEFSYEAAKSRLVNLHMGADDGPHVAFAVPGDVLGTDVHFDEEGGFARRQGQFLRLSGWIDIESRLTVGCAGAVITYLQRRRAAGFLPGDNAASAFFRITAVEMFSLKGSMFINADTLLSLQVIQSETHPHSHNQGPTKGTSGSKEGLSVYGLFHHLARTPQGKYLLRQYFLRPSMDKAIIDERLDTISILLRPDNMAAMDDLVSNLRMIKNVRLVMINLRKGISGGSSKGGVKRGVWATLREFAYHTLKIRDAFQDVSGAERLPVRGKIFEQFEPYLLAQVGRKIQDVIDFEESARELRTCVLPGVDEELDNMKRTYGGLEDLLDKVATNLASEIPQALNINVNVCSFPQIGYLVAVPIDPVTNTSVWEGTAEEPWQRRFNTENRAYYKNRQTLEMDDYFGDLHGQICDKEIEIVHDLAQSILEYEKLLTTVSDICGELDSLLALAQGARQYNLARPQVTEENVIKIEKGRHILQELTVPSYVANDVHLVGGRGAGRSESEMVNIPVSNTSRRLTEDPEDGPSMLILTGPNFSGKSVYLKQVALIIYMAHIGSFVPAERARIGLTDKILTRIATRESVSRIQSAFMIDLQQISIALTLATRRSLLIIDEFGKGTESDDGAGLACGVFEHLLSLGDGRPKVVGATHFHEIFESGFLEPRPALSFGHMDVRIDTEAAEVENQIVYLYSFCKGRSISSFGTCCAAMNGIGPEIIQRAEDLILVAMRDGNPAAAYVKIPQEDVSELEDAEHIARDFLQATMANDPRQLLEDILTVSATTTSRSKWTGAEDTSTENREIGTSS